MLQKFPPDVWKQEGEHHKKEVAGTAGCFDFYIGEHVQGSEKCDDSNSNMQSSDDNSGQDSGRSGIGVPILAVDVDPLGVSPGEFEVKAAVAVVSYNAIKDSGQEDSDPSVVGTSVGWPSSKQILKILVLWNILMIFFTTNKLMNCCEKQEKEIC